MIIQNLVELNVIRITKIYIMWWDEDIKKPIFQAKMILSVLENLLKLIFFVYIDFFSK